MQQLRFVPPWLTSRHIDRQTDRHYDQLIWRAKPAELIAVTRTSLLYNEDNVTASYNKQYNIKYNKRLANAKRPHDCSVLCLRPKSSLYSSPHCILDITSFSCTDSMRRTSNNGVGQFKKIFQVEGNTFRPIFFTYFIADWLLYNSADERFHTTKPCGILYSTEIEFYPEKLKNWFLSHPLGDLRVNVRTPSVARWKAPLDFLFVVIECFRYLLRFRCYKWKSVKVGVFRRGVSLRG